MSSAISCLVRQAVKTNTIPYDDPFYSPANIRRLEKAVDDVRSGRAVLTEHELIEAD